jgi:hypothetical protein
MPFSKEDYKIEEAKSLITLGGNCLSGGVAGLVASITAMWIAGHLEPTSVRIQFASGSSAFVLVAFTAVLVFSLFTRDLGLKKLKNIYTQSKLKSKNG